MKKLRTSGLLFSRAVDGFLQFKAAESLAKGTIVSYRQHLESFHTWLEDPEGVVQEISTQTLCEFLVYLREEYVPRRITGHNDKPLSPKTIHNVWISLSAFFTWASTEFEFTNPMKGVPVPKFQKVPVDVFSKEQVEVLLKACDHCHEAQVMDRRKYVMPRWSAKRDRAMIMVLLDCGLRANELCSLKIGDLDIKTGKVNVKHGQEGGAKGGKGRVVFMGKATRRVVWRYLADRVDGNDQTAPLFLACADRPMRKDGLRQLIVSLGKRAGVTNCHPHRFRHTFAITYLRSGGDVFTLQALLGHGSLDMVQHYARIAQVDVENAHRRASPADNWHL